MPFLASLNKYVWGANVLALLSASALVRGVNKIFNLDHIFQT